MKPSVCSTRHPASKTIVLLMLFSLLYLPTEEVSAEIIQTVDEAHQWVKHVIASNVQRGNGSLTIADVNNDGKTDVLISLGSRNHPDPSDGVWWYEAPGWTFRRLSHPDFPIRWSLSLTAGDVDNDGDEDVVALSFDDSNVYLSMNPLNNGGDASKPWPTLKIFESPGVHRDGERVELVDVDGDGFKDVLFPRGRPAEVRVLFNPSGIVSNPWQNTLIGIHGGSDAHDVVSTDVDLDGDLDIVTASGDGTWLGRVFWYEHPDGQPRDGIWTRHLISGGALTDFLVSHIPHSGLRSRLSKFIGYANYGGLQIDDIDKDGRPDILVTEAHGTPGKIFWYKNPIPSTSAWEEFFIDTQNFPHAGLSFDTNGDGVKEYWVPDASHEGKKVGGIVYYQIQNAERNEWTKHIVAFPPEVGRQSRVADMDGDGDLDVVSTADHSLTGNSIVWWGWTQ